MSVNVDASGLISGRVTGVIDFVNKLLGCDLATKNFSNHFLYSTTNQRIYFSASNLIFKTCD